MVTFGVIGFLVLILIYFVLRSQNLQKELSQSKHALKTSDSHSKFTVSSLTVIAKELQKSYLSRLAATKRHALVSDEDFELANCILTRFEYVLVQCCDNSATIEEAVTQSLNTSEHDLDQIKQFIAKQPQEIKLPWCKNTIAGYITACHNISNLGNPKKKAAENNAEQTPAA